MGPPDGHHRISRAIDTVRRDAYVAGAAAAARPGADFYLAGIADPPRLWQLLGAHGIGADEIKSRFGPYFAVAGQQRRSARLVAYHLVRNGGKEAGECHASRSSPGTAAAT